MPVQPTSPIIAVITIAHFVVASTADFPQLRQRLSVIRCDIDE